MSTPTTAPVIHRSSGTPVGVSGLRAGGGGTALFQALNEVVDDAAARLSVLYGGAPVIVRFNSDRMSGGVWLETSEVDRYGNNCEVGVTAASDTEGNVSVSVYLRRIAIPKGWERQYAEMVRPGEGEVASVDDALRFIEANAVLDFEVIRDRYALLLERKRLGLL